MAIADSPAGKVLQRMTSFSMLVRPATYQALQSADDAPFQEYAISKRAFWSRRSLYYWIAFLSNSLLVVCGLSGYVISNDRDSVHEPKNCARFTIVAVYTVPTMLVTGLLVSSSYNLCWQSLKILTDTSTHIRLALFGAAMNALAFLFMDIYALVLDDPDSRFGTSDDIRNTLLHLIILFTSISSISLTISVWITYSQKQAYNLTPLELPSTAPVRRARNDIEGTTSPSRENASVTSR